jgi:hypothetical protein
METRKTAAGAIGAELRAVASALPRMPLFELAATETLLCVWQSAGVWHASFGTPDFIESGCEVLLISPVTRAIKEAAGRHSNQEGILDLVIYDTAEFHELAIQISAAS